MIIIHTLLFNLCSLSSFFSHLLVFFLSFQQYIWLLYIYYLLNTNQRFFSFSFFFLSTLTSFLFLSKAKWLPNLCSFKSSIEHKYFSQIRQLSNLLIRNHETKLTVTFLCIEQLSYFDNNKKSYNRQYFRFRSCHFQQNSKKIRHFFSFGFYSCSRRWIQQEK